MIYLNHKDSEGFISLGPDGARNWLQSKNAIDDNGNVDHYVYLNDNSSACKNILFSFLPVTFDEHYEIKYTIRRMSGNKVLESFQRLMECNIRQEFLKINSGTNYDIISVGNLKPGYKLYPSLKLMNEMDDYPDHFTGISVTIDELTIKREKFRDHLIQSKTNHYDYGDVVVNA